MGPSETFGQKIHGRAVRMVTIGMRLVIFPLCAEGVHSSKYVSSSGDRRHYKIQGSKIPKYFNII